MKKRNKGQEPAFLYLPHAPARKHLWANLAATRLFRRRIAIDGANYSELFGITADELPEILNKLRIRENILERAVR